MSILDNFFKRDTIKTEIPKDEISLTFMPNQNDIPLFNNSDREYWGELLYAFGTSSDTMRTIANALRQEVTRRGLTVEKSYESKCLDCDSEYDYEVSECPFCKSNRIVFPDPTNRKRLLKIIKHANETESLIDIVKQWQDDYTFLDNAYLICKKRYEITNGKIKNAEVLSFHRGDPILMRKLIRRDGKIGYEDNSAVYVSPLDRATKYTTPQTINGIQTYPAHYAQRDPLSYTNSSSNNKLYFLEKEVFHNTLYTPTKNIGISPILSLFVKIKTLMKQDQHILKTYTGDRSPNGILGIMTSNRANLKTEIDKMKEYIKTNPSGIPTLIIDQIIGNKGNPISYIDMMKSLGELQFIEQREEYRKVIGSFYGVSPIFQNDTSASGGLNNERLQIIVTNRAIENAQNAHNQLLENISEQLGISDWRIKLLPSEERDEMNELLLEKQKLENALIYQQLGYKVEKQDDGDFSYIDDDSVRLSNQLNQVTLPSKPSQSNNQKSQKMDGEPFDSK